MFRCKVKASIKNETNRNPKLSEINEYTRHFNAHLTDVAKKVKQAIGKLEVKFIPFRMRDCMQLENFCFMFTIRPS